MTIFSVFGSGSKHFVIVCISHSQPEDSKHASQHIEISPISIVFVILSSQFASDATSADIISFVSSPSLIVRLFLNLTLSNIDVTHHFHFHNLSIIVSSFPFTHLDFLQNLISLLHLVRYLGVN
jgi:hypothetical protein